MNQTTRRQFLGQTAKAGIVAGSGSALTGLWNRWTVAGEPDSDERRQGTADSCIFLWLGGGACHIDTWDPKRRGDAKAQKPGSYYDPLPTAVDGVQLCEHLPRMARLLDRCVLLRSVHHEVIDEHAAAVNRLHTGRPPTGTTVYPSIGSVVAHQLGPRGDNVPAYVLMGYPSASRGPGFLGAKYGHVYLTDTEAGPAVQCRPGTPVVRGGERPSRG